MKVNVRPIELRPQAPSAPGLPARPPRQASVVALAPGVSCLFADRRATDAQRAERLAIDAGDTGLPRPIVLAALPLTDGGTRHVVLVRDDASALARRRITFTLGGDVFAILNPEWLQSPVRPAPDLARNLAAAGIGRLAGLLLTAGARLFSGPGGGAGLLAQLRALGAADLGPSRWHRTGLRSGILSVPVPPALARNPEALVLIAQDAARHLPPAQVLTERTERGGWLHVMLPRRPGVGDVLAGIADAPFVVSVPEGASLPLAPALARHPPEVAAWAEAALAETAGGDEVAAAVLSEITGEDQSLRSLRITHISRTRSGIFLQVDGSADRAAELRVAIEGHSADLTLAPRAPRAGFAAMPRHLRPDEVVSVTEHLGSGRVRILHRGPVPDLALHPGHVGRVGPALARAALDLAQPGGAATAETIGEPGKPRPLAVLARFGSDDALRALVASLSAGRRSPRVDLVVLAEAGDEADRARRILRGCHAVFAQPATLVSVDPGAPDAPAIAAALRVVGGDRVLILGRNVIPLGAAWRSVWLRAIRPCSTVPVGGALLAPDGSILHAGGRLDLRKPADRAVRQRGVDAGPCLPGRSSVASTSFSVSCVGLSRAAVAGFIRESARCPDAEALLSLLAFIHGGTTRLDCRAVRYGGEPEADAAMSALRPHMIAALVGAAHEGGRACGS